MKKELQLKKYLPYVLLIIPFFFIKNYLDNDIWFILNHGRYLVNNWPSSLFTKFEPFTLHNGLSFSFQKWLSSIIFYLIYSIGKEKGVLLFVYLMCGIIEYLFYLNLKNLSNNKIINIIITSISCSYFFNLFGVSRPQLFSYICLLLEFYFIEKYIKTNKIKYLISLPIISFFYMQLHSTMWIMFMIMLLPYLCDFTFISNLLKCEKQTYNKKPIYIFSLLSFIAAIINPYNLSSITYLLKSGDISNFGILELATPGVFQALFYGGFYYWIILYLIINFIVKKQNKTFINLEIPLRYLYILLGMFILGIVAIRNLAYLILYSGILTSYIFRNLNLVKLKIKLPHFFKIIPNIVYYGFLIYFLILLCILIEPHKKSIYSGTNGYEIIESLNQYTQNKNHENVIIYTDFNTGGYAEWFGYKTYLDPRAEIFTKKINKKEDILNEALKFRKQELSYKFMQSKYNFQYWIISIDIDDKINLKNDDNYKLLDEKSGYRLYLAPSFSTLIL